MVATSGMGNELAKESALLLANMGVRGIVSFGTAGGLSPGLKSGDLVLPKSVVCESDGSSFDATPSWHSALLRRLGGSQILDPSLVKFQDTLLQPAKVIADPAQKATLFRESKCVAADMESAGVASICAKRGLAFATVRVVTDDCNTTIPSCVLDALDVRGNLSLTKLGWGLLKKPWQVFPLLRLGVDYAKARRRLLAAIAELGTDFALPAQLQ